MVTIPRYELLGADEWCRTCDDTYTDECADAGHSPLVTDKDFHFEVCGHCKGHGVLRGWPGVYTTDDFESPEDIDDYMASERTCEDCNGVRVVEALNDKALARPEIQQWIRDVRSSRAIETQERRMGA